MNGHDPRTNRLDFGGNPDLGPDPGIFEGILPLRYWQYCKGSSSGSATVRKCAY